MGICCITEDLIKSIIFFNWNIRNFWNKRSPSEDNTNFLLIRKCFILFLALTRAASHVREKTMKMMRKKKPQKYRHV